MSILNLKARHRDPLPADASMAALLPLAVSLPAVTVMFGGRFGTLATVALVVGSLALIACTAGLAARAARGSAGQSLRDEAVLDALEPLAGLRR
ncbi:hypothetical protein HET69_21495 [Streptomyces sp. CJ_13]|uniref:hypothetical protein n=1 Tax=Streptomyces TaxID=1883 RepID=UPI000F3A9B93|nr:MULTISPECIES: hypothetical protein [unclassified Streptomyces]AYV25518.1 hypothetical protein EES41_02070 [Streptomyces sp. ADI95-16]MBT1186507.1 hypothetical protein [Streptomyces sp. CJ_13]